MKIPILNGVYTGQNADYKTLYPVNMMPVVQDTGVNNGYLRPVEGIVKIGDGVGLSRGAINWNGKHYRVMGSKLCLVDSSGNVTVLGAAGKMGSGILLLTAVEMADLSLKPENKGKPFCLNAMDLSQEGLAGLLRYLKVQVTKIAEKKIVWLRKMYADRADLIENEEILNQSKSTSKDLNFSLKDISLNLYGLCQDCNNKVTV